MTILHVIPSLNPRDGGPVTAVRDFVRAAARHGCESEVATLDTPDAVWLRDVDCPVTACGEGKSPALSSGRLTGWMVANASRFDCAVVHGLWLSPTRCAAQVHRRTGLPFAVYVHGMLDVAHRTTFPIRHLKKSLWWAMCEHRVLSEASAIFFTSDVEKRLAARTFWPRLSLERARIAPYCVEPPPSEADKHVEMFRQRFPSITSKRLLLFLSRLHPKKGIELLLEAFAAAAPTDPALHLMIAGSGEPRYERKLRAHAASRGLSERITWPGLLQDEMKWGALRSADLLCLLSYQENFGIVIAEALACGTPVLITNRVNIAPTISSAGAGIVTDCSHRGASEGLQRWLSTSRTEQTAMRSHALSCFASEFSSDRAATRFLASLPRRKNTSWNSECSAAGAESCS